MRMEKDLKLKLHLMKENVFRCEAFEILFQGLFIDLEPVLERRVEEEIVIHDRGASPGGVVAASPVQGVAFKDIQQSH